MNIPVVYEDEWLLVVDKPSGLLVIPTPKNEQRTLTAILCRHPCHRLDRETSGLIIYAKGKSIQKKMMEEFKQRMVNKKYVAFVQGRISQDEGRIKSPIERMAAETKYRVIQRKKDFTVVEAMPLTGRTNQLRIHFKRIGHPILGESKFAFRRDFKVKARRLCLHASGLGFRHPVTEKYIRLSADLPLYFKEFLKEHD